MSVDLSTTYMGLKLKNPLVVGACPLTNQIEWLERLERLGAGAVVLPSLFEEQIIHEDTELLAASERGSEFYAEHSDWYPMLDEYRSGTEKYLDLIGAAKKSLEIPVMASLNGTSVGGWTDYAKKIEDAGADALELNIYFVAGNIEDSAEDVERRYLDLVEAVKKSIGIPMAVKIGPHFSSPGNMCKRLAAAGADGLVVFNRFLQPDIDLEDGNRSAPGAQLAGRDAVAAALDRHPSRSREHIAGGDQWRSRLGRTDQGAAGGCRRRPGRLDRVSERLWPG